MGNLGSDALGQFRKATVTLENGQDKIVLHDLLIGEVWFGSANLIWKCH